jgi:penicillin-binding protein A
VGGIVAVHVPTGRVLAWQEYRRRGQAGHPITEAMTPAASLFKIVTAVALFERTPVLPTTNVCISGGERGVERAHLTPPARDVPTLCRPFEEALGFSRNAVFAQLATEHLLHRDLIDVAERLGFNRPLAFDTPASLGTLTVPYNDLEFARTAAGFRGSKLSVLGGAQLAYLVANGGRAPRMTLNAMDPPEPAAAAEAEAAPMQPRTARRLRRMMEVTVHSGTCLTAFSDDHGQSYLGSIRVAGKTGTLKPLSRGPTTSWFIGFAPSRSPELVVSVMLENSPVWRRKASHVARDVMRAYFHDRPGVTHPLEISDPAGATDGGETPSARAARAGSR